MEALALGSAALLAAFIIEGLISEIIYFIRNHKK